MIHLIDVMTGEDRHLTDDAVIANEPLWSPDGKRLIYSGKDSSGFGTWMLEVDSGPARLVARDAVGIGWLFDGKRILALSESSMIDLVVVDVETGERSPVWPEMSRESGQPLRFRADDRGHRLVLLIGDEAGTHSLHELDLATLMTRRLAVLPPEAELIDWSDCLGR